MKVSTLITDEAKQVLTEESLQAIEEAFTKKLDLTVESALAQQDDLYAKKLEQLIAAIDKDHTTKLKRVVEAIDKSNTRKLVNVVNKYESELTNEASNFKETLVESISNYLEEFLDEAIPAEAITEATKNRTAREVLGNLRKVLAIDSALMSESVQDAVVDGKKQIDELSKKVEDLSKENALIKESYSKTKSALILESKTSGLSDKKKEYIKRVLSDKTPKFIEENFDYTLRLFDKKEQERINIIKEQAFSERKVKADAPVIRESAQPKQTQDSNPYISELQRYK
jgi:hypothetical protein